MHSLPPNPKKAIYFPMEALWLHSDGQQTEFILSQDLFLSNLSADLVPVCTNDVQSHHTPWNAMNPLNCTLPWLKHSQSFAFSSDGMQINADEVEKYNKLARMKINCWRVSFLRVRFETIVSLAVVEVGSVVEAKKRGVMKSSLAWLLHRCLFAVYFSSFSRLKLHEDFSRFSDSETRKSFLIIEKVSEA